MNCPNCHEDLGLNDICINPACSNFGTIIKSSEKAHLNNAENNYDNKNSFNKSTGYNSNHDNSNYYDKNDYNINSYANNQLINKSTATSFNTSDNISREEFAAFIGSHNTYYYLDYTNKMKNNDNFLSWNWPCFFLGAYWLLYRKLYAFAAVLIVLNISFSLLFDSKIPMLFLFIIRITLAIFANAIYLNNSKRKIRSVKIIIQNLSTTQYINRLHKKGGVNLVAPLIILVISTVFILISIVISLLDTSIVPYDFSSPSYQY